MRDINETGTIQYYKPNLIERMNLWGWRVWVKLFYRPPQAK